MIENRNSLRIFTPGPTPVPLDVMSAVAAPQPHHKSTEFRVMMRRIADGLQDIFRTKQPVLPITCSGTGGIEAAMRAIHRNGDKVVVINNGRFAARWKTMLEYFGFEVRGISRTWGQVVQPEEVASVLKGFDADAVWIVHSETSTGALSDLRGICQAVKQAGSRALVCADCITSIGVYDIPMDEWQLDVAVVSSQKAFMCPPGLAFVALSERAWQAAARPNRAPTMYFDLHAAKKSLNEGLTVFTPAVNILSGLDAALDMMRRETLPNIAERHENLAAMIRSSVEKTGLSLLPDIPSNALTVVRTPDFGERLVSVLRDTFGILIANGQDRLRNNVVRIGHLGHYSRTGVSDFCADFVRAVEIVRPAAAQFSVHKMKSSVTQTIVLSTNNRHKITEISAVLYDIITAFNVKLLTLDEAGIAGLTIEETGKTLEENAYIKVQEVFRRTGLPSLADDTGLEVEALGGAPGVRSARYAGVAAQDSDNRAKLLAKLKNTNNRAARFRSILCFTDGVRTFFAEGICAGNIAQAEAGDGGFGYDSLFIPDGYAMSFAEMSPDEKNAISHRSRAVHDFARKIEEYSG
ncbi:hypothetical protein MASR2M18_07990 [Ignavibacteria bacterium]|nr:RdgB/HAM1 family non-canonical purine NTP pyrophosphatase [Bacteroidota bacterium]MCZ2132928.1 RdgB/HAM1 family non-canonical purine NTP pyrophosphatase [Bacteroidota bacterium]